MFQALFQASKNRIILTSLCSSDHDGCQPLSLVLYPILAIILAYVRLRSNFMSVPELPCGVSHIMYAGTPGSTHNVKFGDHFDNSFPAPST